MKQEKHKIRCSKIEKRLGKYCFFEKSYKDTRTKNLYKCGGIADHCCATVEAAPMWGGFYHRYIFWRSATFSAAAMERRWVKS